MPSQREHSRQNWISRGTTEDINAGSLQRIADATEKMAGNYTKLQNDLKDMEKSRNWYKDQYYKEQRRNASYRGVITKLKKKLK